MSDFKISQETDLTLDEKEMIFAVLNKYNFEAVRITKTRNAYKVEGAYMNNNHHIKPDGHANFIDNLKNNNADTLNNPSLSANSILQGEYIYANTLTTIYLKRIKHGRYKIQNGTLLAEELYKNGFFNVIRYLKTKEGYYFVRYKKYIFYATEWIDGEACSPKNLDQMVDCIHLLARFHIAANSSDLKGLHLRNNLKNWTKIFSNTITELELFKKIISKKRIKNEFDSLYYTYIDAFFNRGMSILHMLNKSEYYRLSKQAAIKKTICHDSFHYQNIIQNEEKYYLMNLETVSIDLQISDLGKFIRKLMFKEEYGWNFDIAIKLIHAYTEVNPLSKSEMEILLAILVFPYKFWKLGKKRYVKHKNWPETKYNHKLSKLIRYAEAQQQFLEQYLEFLENQIENHSN